MSVLNKGTLSLLTDLLISWRNAQIQVRREKLLVGCLHDSVCFPEVRTSLYDPNSITLFTAHCKLCKLHAFAQKRRMTGALSYPNTTYGQGAIQTQRDASEHNKIQY